MLPPLPAEDWDDAARDALASVVPPERRDADGVGNALGVLVRHPELARHFLQFNNYLQRDSLLPERIRELVILRTAYRVGCGYEWGHHAAMGLLAGLTEADVESARSGSAADEFDQTVLAAADELVAGAQLSPETWARLGQRLDNRQRMDLIFTVGGYMTLAMALNTFEVPLEAGAGSPEFYEPVGASR
ncbi:carboxymuconolactone decarboxylase family protein [Mycolicibacterium smegmatis]|uniref:Carboxymuconolactone decarboxylase n=1 Tax=Mycolicibacterium smegmatis (strain MKD8) TaxID=1214915 RepID=A0A2U9PZV5_MYCSE|nr:carboxymuconolactone decarboxylase family protein [Mycolicibacterium smegmatis]AWT57349.1 carboxymuconolactone decarboxylase [Mycolicibacterium smegmatis MKD8]